MNSSWLSGGKMLKLGEILVAPVVSSTRVRYQPPAPVPSRVLSLGGVQAKDPEFEMFSI
jgi:hypothetical protein